ncbi:MAG: DUF2683 family protein [Pelobium sp.]
METLIIHPENKEQIEALKAFLNAFKIRFEAKTEKNKIDLSDLVGKLSWEGDALEEQKKIRSEWD